MTEEKGVWRTISGRRVFIRDGQVLSDAMKESGKFGTSDAKKQRKINSVDIDFTRDNVLPELNKEDLEELGKASKPVLLKKGTLDRNLHQHPEVSPNDYNRIIGQTLYDSDEYFGGKTALHNPDYVNFVKYGEGRGALTLIEMAETKDFYEIVHVFEPNTKRIEKMKRKK